MVKSKDLGQVFTPRWVVEDILDRVGYSGPQILNRTLLEPSSGEGAFLIVAAERLIAEAANAQLTPMGTAELLHAQIHGVEYDQEVLDVSLQRLDALAQQHGLPPVNWNIHHQDALQYEHFGEYDYVVGNPPYIRVHNMSVEMREQVKKFVSATGTTDLYVIFYELGLLWLKAEGMLGFIAPNSWLKNASQKQFRKLLIHNQHVVEVLNYGTQPVFGREAATYTATVLLSKSSQPSTFRYKDVSEGWSVTVPYDRYGGYTGAPLSFWAPADEAFMGSFQEKTGRIADFFTVQNGVATLRDKIFLNAPSEPENPYVKPVVKASTYKGGAIDSTIFFPYNIRDELTSPISEKELQRHNALYAYLLNHQQELLSRDVDKTAAWFHYGRSQGVQQMRHRKLVFSHVIAPDQKTIKAFILPEDTVVYSGLFITENDSGWTLEQLKKIVESENFCRYLRIHGKDISGGYKTFGSKPVKSFPI